MAQYDMIKEITFLEENGYTREQLKADFDLFGTLVSNRSKQNQMKQLVQQVKDSQLKQDSRILYTCHECGYTYKAKIVSKYSQKPPCPCCGEQDMIS